MPSILAFSSLRRKLDTERLGDRYSIIGVQNQVPKAQDIQCYLLREVLVRCSLLHAAPGQATLEDLVAVYLLLHSATANEPIHLQRTLPSPVIWWQALTTSPGCKLVALGYSIYQHCKTHFLCHISASSGMDVDTDTPKLPPAPSNRIIDGPL